MDNGSTALNGAHQWLLLCAATRSLSERCRPLQCGWFLLRIMLDLALFDSAWFKIGVVAVAFYVISRRMAKSKRHDGGDC
jgi:hypothetical protein